MDPDRRRLWFLLFNEVGIIAQLNRALMDDRLPEGLSLPHFSVVNHLIRRPDCETPNQIARAFQVPKNTMTHTLGGLSARGYVEIVPNPGDGRSKIVRVTEAGRRFREAAIERIGPDLDALAASLPAADVASLVERLAEIRVVLDAARD